MSFDSDRKLRRWGRVFGTLSTRTWLHLGVPELISPNLNKGKREEEKAQLNVSWHVLYSKSQVMNNWGDHSTIIARIPDTDTRYRFCRWRMFIKSCCKSSGRFSWLPVCFAVSDALPPLYVTTRSLPIHEQTVPPLYRVVRPYWIKEISLTADLLLQ